MRTLVVLLVALLFGCAAEVADQDDTPMEQAAEEQPAVKTQALVNGCHGYLSIVPAAPAGTVVAPGYTGTVWNHTVKVGNECLYQLPGYEYLYSPTAQTCARYDARTWYCSGFGVFTCPASIVLSRPNGASDEPFGPYAPFGRYNISKHTQAVMPFANARFETVTGAGRVTCIYNAYGTTYKYTPG